MPIYRLTLYKTLTSGTDAGKKWSNVYHLNEASAAAALLHAPTIVDLEKTVYPDNVRIYRYSISDPAAPNTGLSEAVTVDGTRVAGVPATQLPLFNTVLYKFQPASGRASLKYLRLPLDESEVTSGLVESALTDAISASWASPLVSDAAITDESGQAFTGYGHSQAVVARQLGWNRRTRVGMHRGWVPD